MLTQQDLVYKAIHPGDWENKPYSYYLFLFRDGRAMRFSLLGVDENENLSYSQLLAYTQAAHCSRGIFLYQDRRISVRMCLSMIKGEIIEILMEGQFSLSQMVLEVSTIRKYKEQDKEIESAPHIGVQRYFRLFGDG